MIKINGSDIVKVYKPNIIKGYPNLLKSANVELKSTNYAVGYYPYDVKPIIGKTYTLTLCYKCGERTSYIAASHYNRDLFDTTNFSSKTKTIESKSFTVLEHNIPVPTDMRFFNIPYLGDGQDGNYNDDTVIYWALLQEGDVGNQKEFIPANSEITDGIICPEFTNNLVENSDKFTFIGTGNGITASVNSDGEEVITVESGNENWALIRYSLDNRTEIENSFSEGDDFTISFTIKSSDNNGKIPDVYIKSGMGYYKQTGTISSEYSVISYSGKWKKDGDVQPHLGWSECVGTYIIKNWKIEKGNNPNPIWTPNVNEIMVPVKKIYKGSELVY